MPEGNDLAAGQVLACQEARQEQSGVAAAHATPAGEPKTPKTRLLEAGAKLLQDTSPLKPFDIYLVGFHPMKDHPENQMEAHHYCQQVNEDFAQCVLFDGNTIQVMPTCAIQRPPLSVGALPIITRPLGRRGAGTGGPA